MVDVRRLELARVEAETHLEDVMIHCRRIGHVDVRCVGRIAQVYLGPDALEADHEGSVRWIVQPHPDAKLAAGPEELV